MRSKMRDDLTILRLAVAAWHGAAVDLTVAEWERAELLLEGTV